MSRASHLVLVLLGATISSCSYDASFADCLVRCASDLECPDGLQCRDEGLCRLPTNEASCTLPMPMPDTPSCVGLPTTCGPSASDDCCSPGTPISPGTFSRSHDLASDALYPDARFSASVSAFHLDKYEVTVGRFRSFVTAGGGTRQHPPAADAGAHARIVGSGWSSTWNASLVAEQGALVAALKCDPARQTWTDAASSDETQPINCITWYEAAAFCAWDGGYLPTESEWNYAATGGDEQRAYPWSNPASSTTIDCSRANYASCATHPQRVGATSTTGDGRWSQSDLAGNVWEWTLDWAADPYPSVSCIDCANLTPGTGRILRGGSFLYDATFQRTALRKALLPTGRFADVGLRCARAL